MKIFPGHNLFFLCRCLRRQFFPVAPSCRQVLSCLQTIYFAFAKNFFQDSSSPPLPKKLWSVPLKSMREKIVFFWLRKWVVTSINVAETNYVGILFPFLKCDLFSLSKWQKTKNKRDRSVQATIIQSTHPSICWVRWPRSVTSS